MELRKLEHFVAVAEEQSFTRAAARVHAGQSALSVSVRALERELGVRLLDRTTRGVALTDVGRAVLPEALRTLAAAEGVHDAIASAEGLVRGTLRIGIMQALTLVDMGSLLAQFHALHPGVDIRPRSTAGGSSELIEETRRGHLDAAFVAVSGEPPSGLSARLLASEPLTLACAPDEPVEPQSIVALDDLAAKSFIEFPAGWGIRGEVDRLFAAAGLERTIAVEVADFITFVELVRAGLGIGFLPGSALSFSRHRVGTLAVAAPPRWNVSIVMPDDRPPTAAARAFLDLLSASF